MTGKGGRGEKEQRRGQRLLLHAACINTVYQWPVFNGTAKICVTFVLDKFFHNLR